MNKQQGITEEERLLLLNPNNNTFNDLIRIKDLKSDFLPRSMKQRKKLGLFSKRK